jgi:DnaJ-class molecular chaperone
MTLWRRFCPTCNGMGMDHRWQNCETCHGCGWEYRADDGRVVSPERITDEEETMKDA